MFVCWFGSFVHAHLFGLISNKPLFILTLSDFVSINGRSLIGWTKERTDEKLPGAMAMPSALFATSSPSRSSRKSGPAVDRNWVTLAGTAAGPRASLLRR